jgi:beta-mannanase
MVRFKKILLLILRFIFSIFLLVNTTSAQLKYLVEDFEGFADGNIDLKENGVFSYGNASAAIDATIHTHQNNYSGQRAIKLQRTGKLKFGGWGKGITSCVELDVTQDHFNFYVLFPSAVSNSLQTLVIQLQEDDDDDNIFKKEKDDSWTYILAKGELSDKPSGRNEWQLVSIPLNKFKDDNEGGDGIFNVSYKLGKLLTFILAFPEKEEAKMNEEYFFDFICFSKGKLPVGSELFDAPAAAKNDLCQIGSYSKVGEPANFIEMGEAFEKMFEPVSVKKLGFIHLFQPFGKDDGSITGHYPSIERINKIISEGYIPMITLENHFINADKNAPQPNLYSIVEGHYDSFFGYWANQIKQVKGTVMLRILHEFNGDWYPWCVSNNNKDPKLLARAYGYIRTIFKQNNVTNVKFIWCPNSMSLPQENWNNIMDAYPGNDYVDYVGMDIYNGAGKSILWRSFRKEGIENYFILTQKFPTKPLLICEIASRERKANEPKNAQDKAEWIKQMSEALKTDMSKIKMITWFNEKETFKINSSPASKDAYLKYVLQDPYFRPVTNSSLPVTSK